MKKIIIAIAMGLVSGWATAQAADGPQTALAPAKPARFVENLATGKKQIIVTMGTSLTDGGAWVSQLQAELSKKFPGLATVKNLGRGASSTAVPAGRCGLDMVKDVVAAKPNTVFIEYGMNDCYLPYNISLGQARDNLNTIIDTILKANPSAEVILQTMNCCKDFTDKGAAGKHASTRPRLADYYQIYRDVAARRSLLLIDHYPHWLALMNESPDKFDKLVPDRIHPNAKGAAIIILPTLKKSIGLND